MSSVVSLKRWQLLSPSEQAAVLGLQVTEQQVEFAGTVEHSVLACQEDQTNEVAGLAVLYQHSIVGFLLLKRGMRAPSWANPNSAVVSAMRVAISQQGKGIGSAALNALPFWVAANWPELVEVTLSVDEENHLGRNAYSKAGFVDLGKRDRGRIGWVRYMSKPVKVVA